MVNGSGSNNDSGNNNSFCTAAKVWLYISVEVVCCTDNKILDQHTICLILAFNGNNMSPDYKNMFYAS